MARRTMIQAINEALLQKMAADPAVVVLGQDVGVDGGVFRATEGLLEEFGEARVMDTPLTESGIVGLAVGMAVNGLKPVVEIQFQGFINEALDQIFSHVARYRHRSRGRYPMSMVIRAPYGAGVKALEHHSESTEAMFAGIPGLKVAIPATPTDAKGLLLAAIDDPDPVLFFEPKRLYRLNKEDVPEELYQTPIGQARVAREGTDISLLTYGGMVPVCLDAAEHVQNEAVSVEVIDLRTISPFDVAAITASVEKTGRAVIVHEAPRTFGVGAELSATIAERSLLHLLAPVKRVTGYDIVAPLAKTEHLNYPTVERVVRAIHETMEF